MCFIHHSRYPLKQSELHDGDQTKATDWGAKPDGIWFSVGNGADWRALVHSRFNSDDVKYWTEIFLYKTANILRVEDAAGLDALTSMYAQTRNDGKQSIDWHRIAEQFSGIIISSLRVERCNYRWYACWEVPSGCVWRTKAVRCLRPLNY